MNPRFLTDDKVLLDFDIKASNIETNTTITGFNMPLFYSLIKAVESVTEESFGMFSPQSVKIQRIKVFRGFFLCDRFTPHRSSLIVFADAKCIIEAWDDFKAYVIKHARLPTETYPTLHYVKHRFQINK